MSEATRLEQILLNSEKATFDIKQLISGCKQGYQHVYHDMQFNLEFIGMDSESSIDLFGSAEHIVQLLDKVISNAVEFSNDNNINLQILQESQTLILNISNNGPLLPEGMVNSLFDSMISVRGQSKQAQPHLGLGLYIARLICQFHHGEITATNHFQPEGVTISIKLPLNDH